MCMTPVLAGYLMCDGLLIHSCVTGYYKGGPMASLKQTRRHGTMRLLQLVIVISVVTSMAVYCYCTGEGASCGRDGEQKYSPETSHSPGIPQPSNQTAGAKPGPYL